MAFVGNPVGYLKFDMACASNEISWTKYLCLLIEVYIARLQWIFLILSVHPFLKQEILEKFEFFPIKCRIQRASAIFHYKDPAREQNKGLFKTKVGQLHKHLYVSL